jgi:hypothetical protein
VVPWDEPADVGGVETTSVKMLKGLKSGRLVQLKWPEDRAIIESSVAVDPTGDDVWAQTEIRDSLLKHVQDGTALAYWDNKRNDVVWCKK